VFGIGLTATVGRSPFQGPRIGLPDQVFFPASRRKS